MRKVAGMLAFIFAVGLSVDAVACRIAPRWDQVIAHYDAQLTSADQVVVGDVTALLQQAHITYGLELSNVRAIRGTAPAEMTIEAELAIGGCMPTFVGQLSGIDFEPVVILLSAGEPLSIHELDSEFARSVIARLEHNQE